MKKHDPFQDLKEELEQLDLGKELADLDEELKKIDFSAIEKQLQEIDLDFLLL